MAHPVQSIINHSLSSFARFIFDSVSIIMTLLRSSWWRASAGTEDHDVCPSVSCLTAVLQTSYTSLIYRRQTFAVLTDWKRTVDGRRAGVWCSARRAMTWHGPDGTRWQFIGVECRPPVHRLQARRLNECIIHPRLLCTASSACSTRWLLVVHHHRRQHTLPLLLLLPLHWFFNIYTHCTFNR